MIEITYPEMTMLYALLSSIRKDSNVQKERLHPTLRTFAEAILFTEAFIEFDTNEEKNIEDIEKPTEEQINACIEKAWLQRSILLSEE